MQDAPILDAVETEVMDELVSRRQAIAKTGKMSGALAAALAVGSVPIALGALAKDVGAQPSTSPPSTATILGVLQFALLLENLEAEFYRAVTGFSSVGAFNEAFSRVRATFTPAESNTFSLIRDHEVAHVNFLIETIAALGGQPTIYNPATTFDFTGGGGSGTGPFAGAGSDKSLLLLAAQLFEDTGVRAYKGQAGNLLRTGNVLEAALQIHAVEARHAARIRRMRRQMGAAAGATDAVRFSGTVYGEGTYAAGFSGASSLPIAAQLVVFGPYSREGNHNHVVNNGTADVTINADTLANIVGGPDVSLAFDEPLTGDEVKQIIRPFVIPVI